jgi:hypothetical protein
VRTLAVAVTYCVADWQPPYPLRFRVPFGSPIRGENAAERRLPRRKVAAIDPVIHPYLLPRSVFGRIHTITTHNHCTVHTITAIHTLTANSVMHPYVHRGCILLSAAILGLLAAGESVKHGPPAGARPPPAGPGPRGPAANVHAHAHTQADTARTHPQPNPGQPSACRLLMWTRWGGWGGWGGLRPGGA